MNKNLKDLNLSENYLTTFDLNSLPEDILKEICSFLPYINGLNNLRLTSTHLNRTIEAAPSGIEFRRIINS